MKRYIHLSNEVEKPELGFLFEIGNRAIFIKSEMSNLTDRIVRRFINEVCDLKGVGDSIRQSALYNETTLKDFRRRIEKATLEHIETPAVEYYKISGKNFSLSFPVDDFEEQVIVR